jgi:hypothetical protein
MRKGPLRPLAWRSRSAKRSSDSARAASTPMEFGDHRPNRSQGAATSNMSLAALPAIAPTCQVRGQNGVFSGWKKGSSSRRGIRVPESITPAPCTMARTRRLRAPITRRPGAPNAAPVAMGKPPPTAPPGTCSQSCGGAVLGSGEKGPAHGDRFINDARVLGHDGGERLCRAFRRNVPRPGANCPSCWGAGGSVQLSSSASRASASGKSSRAAPASGTLHPVATRCRACPDEAKKATAHRCRRE